MSYTKQNFIDGRKLWAVQLNHMEDGIAEVTDDLSSVKDRVDDLSSNAGAGTGLTDTEKNLMLSLFEGAAYGNASMQSTYNALKSVWGSSGGSSGGGSSGGTTTVAVSSVSLSRSTLSLTAGNSSTLTATVSPSNATNKTVTWSVSPSGYASLSSTSGSSITVTASKAGSCTITATAGGKSASCSVSVTASSGGSTGGTDIPGETPVYKLAAAKTFAAASKEYIDTGVKLFATVDPKPSWTILMEVQGNSLTATSDTYALAHCMEETSPWPGLSIAIWGNGDLGVNLYRASGQVANLSVLNNRSVKIGIVISGLALTTRTNSGVGNYTSVAYTPSATVDKSLLIGAYQQSNGTKGRFFNGTVHQFMVFNKALDVSTVEGWVNG